MKINDDDFLAHYYRLSVTCIKRSCNFQIDVHNMEKPKGLTHRSHGATDTHAVSTRIGPYPRQADSPGGGVDRLPKICGGPQCMCQQ